MTVFDTTLPALLEQQLTAVLKRYQRLRMLRAFARLAMLLVPVATFFALAFWLGAPPQMAIIALVVCLGASGAYCLWPVLLRPATMREIAAHIDENHPELHDSLLSAVSLANSGAGASSAWMLENFLSDTQRNVKGIALDSFISTREYHLLSIALAMVGLAMMVGGAWLVWKVGYVRSAFIPPQAEVAPEFSVEPGDVSVLPGDNQIIWVTSSDTHATRYIFWEQGGVEQRAVLAPSSTPEVAFHTFQSIQESLRYQVRVGTSASPWFEIHVSRPPAVNVVQLEYEYPEYLGLDRKVVPFGGDVAAVEGTKVTFRVEVNKPVASASLVLSSGEERVLAPVGSALWQTDLQLAQSGSYHIALIDEDGEGNPAPDEFDIDVQPDNPPTIRVRFPRGDSEVLPLEEVPLAFEVEDDFGIADYGVEYTVAGHEPVRLALNAGQDIVQQIAGDHLLELEGMGVSIGDLITWSIWANDKKPDRQDFEVSGDPFFLEVRPYVRRYRERITSGGGSAAGQQGEDTLQAQRNVVIALHNLRKEARKLEEPVFLENRDRITTSQAEIEESLREIVTRATPEEAQIAQEALQATQGVIDALAAAVWMGPDEDLEAAYTNAQRVLQLMIKLEPALRTVTRSQGQGGGGGGASQEEIDDLELAKRKDYQEDAKTGAADAAANEALRKALDDLARRQEMLNDDLGKLLSEDEKTLEEEERQRRLERLQEEQARQLERLDALANQLAQNNMDPAQRQETQEAMDQARRAMESSMESAREERLQQARAAGSQAARQLQQAEAGLDNLTREAARERMAALQEQLQGIRDQHQAIQQTTGELEEAQAKPGVDGEPELVERMDRLKSDKEALAEAMEEMLVEAGGLSDQMRENQELLSRKLGDWTRRTSRTGVVEEIEESVPWVDWGIWDAVQDSERQVQRKLDDASESLDALKRYLPGDPEDDMARALDMLRELGAGGDSPREAGEPGEGTPNSDQPGEAGAESGEQREASAESTPQSEGESGDGQAPSNTPGEAQAGNSQGADPSPSGPQGERQPGQGSPGESQAQSPGEGQGSGSESTPSEGESLADNQATPGDGEPQPTEPSGSGAPQNAQGGPQTSDTTGGGGVRGLNEFFGRDASNWRPALQDAAALLPRDSEVREDLERVDMEIGRMQRAFNNNKTLPGQAEFEQVVRRPLMDAIDTLEDLVRARASGEEQWLEDEGEVPSQYVDRVAEYFRLLSENAESQSW